MHLSTFTIETHHMDDYYWAAIRLSDGPERGEPIAGGIGLDEHEAIYAAATQLAGKAGRSRKYTFSAKETEAIRDYLVNQLKDFSADGSFTIEIPNDVTESGSIIIDKLEVAEMQRYYEDQQGS